ERDEPEDPAATGDDVCDRGIGHVSHPRLCRTVVIIAVEGSEPAQNAANDQFGASAPSPPRTGSAASTSGWTARSADAASRARPLPSGPQNSPMIVGPDPHTIA